MKQITVKIQVGAGQVLAGAAAFLLLGTAMELGSETLTMTTTYPSPAGIYKTIITTGETNLARNAGNVILAMGGGNVGIGTASPPAAKLEVAGSIVASGSIRV